MGVVLAATHLHMRERVAIKVLRPDVSARPEAIARFMREARLSLKLRGEHVVRVFDVDVLDGSLPYIVMEHLEGEDLAMRIARDGALPPAEVIDCMMQACEGVGEAHALGIVHRDLKPANLFLARGASGATSLKVLDFGVSKASSLFFESDTVTASSSEPRLPVALPATAEPAAEEDLDLTSTRAMLGSPRYMSPEQIQCSRDVDARTDVWALGAIAYEMLSGEPSFSGDDLEMLRTAITRRTPRSLTAGPARLRALIDRCLSKDPSLRFQDVAALADALAEIGPGSMKERAARIRSQLGMPARPRRWRSTLAALGAAVVALVGTRFATSSAASAPIVSAPIVAVATPLPVAPEKTEAVVTPPPQPSAPPAPTAPARRVPPPATKMANVASATPSATTSASAPPHVQSRPDPNEAFNDPE